MPTGPERPSPMSHRPMPERDRLPHALYRAEQVRHLDRCAIDHHGLPGLTLMERAGTEAYRLLRERWPHARRLVVLVGTGNNGGDGLVIARLAQADGLNVRVLRFGDPARMRGDAATNLQRWLDSAGRIEPFASMPRNTDVLVDAVLGTGLERPLTGHWATAFAAINAGSTSVMAVDIPSGLDADTGRVMGVALRAAVTVSFIGLKQGLFIGAGPEYAGDIHFRALGIPAVVYASEVASSRRIDWRQQGSRLGRRPRTAHKGDFGQVLVIGGAPGMSGAVLLAGTAALRAGAGRVTLATHPAHAAYLNVARPELMVVGVAGVADLTPLLARSDVVAIGPGLGQTDWARELWQRVSRLDQPLVVDADALNLLAQAPLARADWVLTPHPGEAARLLGGTTARIEQDRPAAVQALQARYGGVVCLKGAGTLIQGEPPHPFAVCSDGNPGMATAGTCDLLTGIIAALRAQGLNAEEAASAGVCLHAAAGDWAARAGERGLIAGDLLDAIRWVANHGARASAPSAGDSSPGGI